MYPCGKEECVKCLMPKCMFKPKPGCKLEKSEEKNADGCPKHPCGILKCQPKPHKGKGQQEASRGIGIGFFGLAGKATAKAAKPVKPLVSGCAGTQHGCCDDGKTTAGPNKINCVEEHVKPKPSKSVKPLVGGCAGTQHGCCDDGKTAAGLNKVNCIEEHVEPAVRTATPTAAPTVVPTATPTAKLTAAPSDMLTAEPTAVPTDSPDLVPHVKALEGEIKVLEKEHAALQQEVAMIKNKE